MNEPQNEDMKLLQAALDQARADHAAAMLAWQAAPHNSQVQHALKRAVREWRSAYKAYWEARIAGIVQ